MLASSELRESASFRLTKYTSKAACELTKACTRGSFGCSRMYCALGTMRSVGLHTHDRHPAAAPAGSQSGLEAEDRQNIVEGLARIAAALRPEDAAQAALQVGTPMLQRLQQLLAQASGAHLYEIICCSTATPPEERHAWGLSFWYGGVEQHSHVVMQMSSTGAVAYRSFCQQGAGCSYCRGADAAGVCHTLP